MPKVNMRKAIAVFLLLIPLAAFAQYISYWFQGWQRQGDAADAQAYFMRPGTNIVFTYASNRVYINASGTITNIASSTNSVYAQYATNWLGSNSMWVAVSAAIPIARGIITLPGAGSPTIFTVNTTAANAANVIVLTYFSQDGNNASVNYQNIVPGTSFDIRSSRANDVGKVAWAIFNP